MEGFYNRLLRIDLTKGTWKAEAISDDVLGQYLGGKGLAAHLLMENTPTGVNPLTPENPLIVAIGPANGLHRIEHVKLNAGPSEKGRESHPSVAKGFGR